MKKYFKTTITIEILSERKYNSTDLSKIEYDITDGDCSGKVDIQSYKELTSTEAAKELLAQGSDPEFFNLDQDGRVMDDDLIGYQVYLKYFSMVLHPDMDASFCVYSWSQCKAMIDETELDYWKIVPVMKDSIEEPTLMFEGDPND